MLTLTFNQSKSKRIKEALKYAKKFEDHTILDISCSVTIGLKELFEKWEFFNLMFGIVVKWSGTTLNYEGVTHHTYAPMRRIFYALQDAKTKFFCYMEDRAKKAFLIETKGHEKYINSLDGILDDRISELLIDVFTEK